MFTSPPTPPPPFSPNSPLHKIYVPPPPTYNTKKNISPLGHVTPFPPSPPTPPPRPPPRKVQALYAEPRQSETPSFVELCPSPLPNHKQRALQEEHFIKFSSLPAESFNLT